MRITELIAKLVHIKDEHGDLEVVYVNECCCYGDSELDPNPRIDEWEGSPYVIL